MTLSKTDPQCYVNDIPLATATAAHNGTSHTPERRGEQERSSYANTLAADYATLAKYANTDDKRATLDEMFQAYRVGYRSRYCVMLLAKSRCMSVLVTGGSNFPTARNGKRNASADKRTSETIDFREATLAKITKALRPELRPIMSGDDDATTRLRDKLAALIVQRDAEKAANAAIRKLAKARTKTTGKPTTQAEHMELIALMVQDGTISAGIGKAFMSYARAFPWIPQFGANTGAEIRRVEKRLASVTVAKATTDAAPVVGEHARLEDSTADNRVRLFYPGKPDAETRTRLKSAGFRWTPSLGCWQAYRNHRTLATATREAGAVEAVAVESSETFVEWEASDPDVEAPEGCAVDFERTELTATGYKAPVVDLCDTCEKPTHASESNDAGTCGECLGAAAIRPCAAEENGYSRCDDFHKARGVACGACDPRTAEERGTLSIPFGDDDANHEREAR